MTTDNQTFRHGLSYHTSKAIDKLKEGKPGDLITRAEMATIIDRDCSAGSLGYGNVNSAIRAVEREHRIVWRWSRDDKGWKCLDSTSCVAESASAIRRARRQGKRSLRVSAAVNVAELNDQDRIVHNVNVAIAGAVELFGSSSARKRLADTKEVAAPRIGDIEKLFTK